MEGKKNRQKLRREKRQRAKQLKWEDDESSSWETLEEEFRLEWEKSQVASQLMKRILNEDFTAVDELSKLTTEEDIDLCNKTEEIDSAKLDVEEFSFLVAVENGDVDLVKETLPQINPSFNDNMAFSSAYESHDIDIMTLLLADERVNIKEIFYVDNAYNNEDIELLKLLLGNENIKKNLPQNKYEKYLAFINVKETPPVSVIIG